MSDSPRLPGRPVVVILFCVAVCAFLGATTLSAIVLADDGPDRCCPAGSADSGARPSPTSRASSTRAGGLPMCIVGSWRSVDESFMVKFYTDQPAMPFASSGRLIEFRPDGTGVERHDNVLSIGRFRGNELRIVGNGTLDFRWTATDATITYLSQTQTTLAWSYYDQRGLRSTQPLTPNPNLNEVDNYTCQGTQLTENNANGYRSTWVRTTAFGVYG